MTLAALFGKEIHLGGGVFSKVRPLQYGIVSQPTLTRSSGKSTRKVVYRVLRRDPNGVR